MYPDLSYLVHAITGIEPDNGLSIVKTFGLVLILAFLASAYFFRLELRRKEKEGLFTPVEEKTVVGKPATPMEIGMNALLGFVLAFKLVYIVSHFDAFQADTAGILLSAKGSLIGGLVGGAVFGFWRYWEANSKKLGKPITQKSLVYPSQRVGDITVVAAISGIAGAKLAAMFESVEHIKAFLADPIGQLLSGSGLAIYGGLILAFIVVLWYVKRKGMAPLHTMDAVAPSLMVGYGVGRIGCQLSGDGDWGIVNNAPSPDWWFLPEQLWASTYPHNVLNKGVLIEGCDWQYCYQLAETVFPTPIYETLFAIVIVSILWGLRKRLKAAGMLFFVYVILTGVERFFIEKIRVNPDIELFGLQATQAEYISITLVIIGIAGIIWTWRRSANSQV